MLKKCCDFHKEFIINIALKFYICFYPIWEIVNALIRLLFEITGDLCKTFITVFLIQRELSAIHCDKFHHLQVKIHQDNMSM